MGNCGDDADQQANGFVELYNYGDYPMDVKDWYFMASNNLGNPDEIVSWNTRNPYGTRLPANLITDSTVIQPKSYAVLLAPMYTTKNNKKHMPYTFPENTVILTIADGDWLGNKYTGITTVKVSNKRLRDRLYFYLPKNGSGAQKFWVEKLITTYGLKDAGPEPHVYYNQDLLPLTTYQCQSVQRRIPSHADIYDNWQIIDTPSPGSGPY